MSRMERRSIIGAVMTLMVSFVLVAVVNVLYVTHEIENTKADLRQEQEERERVICGVLNVSQRPRPTPPSPAGKVQPQTKYGKKVAEYNQEVDTYNKAARQEVVNLSLKLNCPRGDSK